MKIRALVITVFAIALGAVAAHAAATQTLGFGGGFSMPSGDVADFVGSGFHFGATHCYRIDPQFGFGSDLNYHMLGEKTAGTLKTSINVFQLDLNGKYFIPMKDAKMAPYIKVGLGMYNLGIKATRQTGLTSRSGTTTENKFGFNAGLGSTWAVKGGASVGVEVLYHMISTENESTNLITAGATYNFKLGK
jgi:opacity protein-like surface antigen